MAASRSFTTTDSSMTFPSMAMRCVLLWAGAAPDIDGSVQWSVPDFGGPLTTNLLTHRGCAACRFALISDQFRKRGANGRAASCWILGSQDDGPLLASPVTRG